MPRVTIRYFTGCPHWQVADERIRLAARGRHDVTVEHELVETPDAAERLAFTGSPTILIDDVDVFAEPGRPIGLSCRVYRTPEGLAGSPTVEQLEQALADAGRSHAGH